MRVVLQVVSGTHIGRKIWLEANQRLRVGATEWADFAVKDDAGLAEVHFSVRCGPDYCRLMDLQTHAGTFVNGRRISNSYLCHGDTIRAGDTRFEVRFEDHVFPGYRRPPLRYA